MGEGRHRVWTHTNIEHGVEFAACTCGWVYRWLDDNDIESDMDVDDHAMRHAHDHCFGVDGLEQQDSIQVTVVNPHSGLSPDFQLGDMPVRGTDGDDNRAQDRRPGPR